MRIIHLAVYEVLKVSDHRSEVNFRMWMISILESNDGGVRMSIKLKKAKLFLCFFFVCSVRASQRYAEHHK